MKKVLFLASHLYSGSSILFDVLNNNPKIMGHRTGLPYHHPDSLNRLINLPHKLNNTSAIYMDELLFNHMFTNKELYKFCKFIYMVGPPVFTINSLIERRVYKPLQAVRYYTFRLRRIYEMRRKTGGVFLTWNDDLSKIESYLNLKEKLQEIAFENIERPKEICSLSLLNEAERAYERTLQSSVWCGI